MDLLITPTNDARLITVWGQKLEAIEIAGGLYNRVSIWPWSRSF
jgi:hypothetical protein